MATLLKRLEKELSINRDFDLGTAKANEPTRRPDLVFLLADGEVPHRIDIIELKSPNLPLLAEHLTQLDGYIYDIEQFLKTEIKRPVRVSGYLIGTLPPETSKNREETVLLKKWREQSPKDQVSIISLQQLADHAYNVHDSALKILESEEDV